MENLINQIEELVNSSQYEQATDLVKKKFGIEMSVEFKRNGIHFIGDKDNRDIYEIILLRTNRADTYTFNFGQSVNKSKNDREEPTLYDVLTSLQKYDIGTFDEFCDTFGYIGTLSDTKKIYRAVCEEFEAMEKLFTEEELEVLSYIQ
jgi:hypothetical protein